MVVGSGGVGKSSCTIQLIQNHFVQEYDPTIENSYRKQVTIDNEVCLLEILDTAQSCEYQEMFTRQAIRTCQAFLCIYSITSRNSFEEISSLRDEILREKRKQEEEEEEKEILPFPYEMFVPIVLVGNKIDLQHQRQVSIIEGMELAKSFNCPFFEASAKTSFNIENSFFQVVREIRKIEKKMNRNVKIENKKKKRNTCSLL